MFGSNWFRIFHLDLKKYCILMKYYRSLFVISTWQLFWYQALSLWCDLNLYGVDNIQTTIRRMTDIEIEYFNQMIFQICLFWKYTGYFKVSNTTDFLTWQSAFVFVMWWLLLNLSRLGFDFAYQYFEFAWHIIHSHHDAVLIKVMFFLPC